MGAQAKRFCIVGGDGAIGGALAKRLKKNGFEVRSSTRRRPIETCAQFSLDLCGDLNGVSQQEYDVVVLAASITKLAECREHPEAARIVNVDAQIQIAEQAMKRGAFVVFLSTNQVFDGTKPGISPLEAPSPRSIYGGLKAEAETKLLRLGPDVAVVRLTKVIGSHQALFETWRQDLLCGKAIGAFDDLMMAPIAMNKVTAGIEKIGSERLSGIWHLGGYEDINYREAGCQLARRLGVDEKLVRATSAAGAGIPEDERPQHTTLAVREFVAATEIQIADARTELDIGLGFVRWP